MVETPDSSSCSSVAESLAQEANKKIANTSNERFFMSFYFEITVLATMGYRYFTDNYISFLGTQI